jgi:cytochrome bd-type quinol oxidase subunit 1
MLTLEETLVLFFLGLVSIWLFARPRQAIDRGFLLIAAWLMITAMLGVSWAFGFEKPSPTQHLLLHLVMVAGGGALAGLSIRLVRKSRKPPPNAPIS